MKMQQRLIIVLVVFASLTSCVQVRLRTANDNFEQFAYSPAANDYEYVLRKRQDPTALANISECYRQMGNSVKSEYWYSKALALPNAKPVWNLYLAEALMKNGKYVEAKKSFSDYLVLNRDDFRAERLMNSCDSIDLFYRDTTLYEVNAMRLNVPGENNLCPTFYRSGIAFLSDRYARGLSRTLSDGTGKRYYDAFYAKKTENGNWLEPEPLRGTVNGRFNEGPMLFTDNDSTLLFTRNNYLSNTVGKNKNNVNVLKIFKAVFVNGEWIIQGDLKIGDGDYSIAHPALAEQGSKLYFVSDMPWGYGGMDIYYSTLENGSWSQPVNLGPQINSEGNEAFPFIWNDSLLFYSSDGLRGMGGLDVYEAHLSDGKWQNPLNVGVPVNSSQDDFSFIIDATAQTGYFSSSRGGQGDKLYSFNRKRPTLNLSVKLTDDVKGAPVSAATVDLFKNGTKTQSLITNANGTVIFDLQEGNEYEIRTRQKNYFHTSAFYSTVNSRYSTLLAPVITLKKVELEKSVVFEGIYFKKKDWQLKLEAAKALERLVTLLTDNPDLQVEIGAYTDSRGSDGENIALTQRRAELVEQYLSSKGVKASRLTARGYGEARLRNKCYNGILCLEEEQEINNRIEIKVVNILSDTGN